MEAMRLIEATRSALAGAGDDREVALEALQAQALAAAIGAGLAAAGPPELRAEARGLSEAGERAYEELHRGQVGAVRAAQLSGVQDPRRVLTALAVLLREVGTALVSVACSTDDEELHWVCVEAVDHADESGDRVRALLRKLAAREGIREVAQRLAAPEAADGPAGGGAGAGPRGGAGLPAGREESGAAGGAASETARTGERAVGAGEAGGAYPARAAVPGGRVRVRADAPIRERADVRERGGGAGEQAGARDRGGGERGRADVPGTGEGGRKRAG